MEIHNTIDNPPIQLDLADSKFKLIFSTSIFFFLFFIFYTSPVDQVMDSNFSMMVSQSLMDNGTFSLDNYKIPRLLPFEQPGIVQNGYPYQLEEVNGHLYYYFPPGSSILSVPFVALMNILGRSPVNKDGTYNRMGEKKIETLLAAILMAILGVLFYYTARQLLSIGWSIIIFVGGTLGTQIWSTASRSLWSDTWGIFLLGCVILILVRQENKIGKTNPFLLATLLSWMYFVRPTYSVAIVAITIYISLFYRALLVPYVITGASWFLAFVIYSWIHFHQLLPNYYLASRLTFDGFWIAFLGNLISPSRGLFLFVPILSFILYLLIRYRRNIALPRLLVLSSIVIIGHLIIISGFPHWWGGHSYGPRLSTGLVPWLVLIGIFGVRAMLETQRDQRLTLIRYSELGFGLMALLLSIAINGYGAISYAANAWNVVPDNIDQNPSRLWEWKYPQFLAGIVRPTLSLPENWDEILLIDMGIDDAHKYMVSGWSGDESGNERTWVWAQGKVATLEIPLKSGHDYDMAITAVPMILPNKEQKVTIWLNGKNVTELTFEKVGEYKTYHINLPAPLIKKLNKIEMDFSYAISPAVLYKTDDTRLLSVSFDKIIFQPKL